MHKTAGFSASWALDVARPPRLITVVEHCIRGEEHDQQIKWHIPDQTDDEHQAASGATWVDLFRGDTDGGAIPTPG
jgi:hypothetical protein